MASRKSYLDYLSEQLGYPAGLAFRPMMGEYLVYLDGKYVAAVCDDRLFVKPLPQVLAMTPSPTLEPPYAGAKPMVVVTETDDSDYLKRLFATLFDALPEKTARKNPKSAK